MQKNNDQADDKITQILNDTNQVTHAIQASINAACNYSPCRWERPYLG